MWCGLGYAVGGCHGGYAVELRCCARPPRRSSLKHTRGAAGAPAREAAGPCIVARIVRPAPWRMADDT